MENKLTKSQQGKKNKRDGAKFELSVRKYLESEGWIVSKWMNNVELGPLNEIFTDSTKQGKLIPAKHKFCGIGRPMSIGTGFPDFVAFRNINNQCIEHIGVEAKSNGRLDAEERQKIDWLLANHIFKEIWIVSKGVDMFTIEIKREGQ